MILMLDTFAVLGVAVILLYAVLALRRRVIQKRGGTFPCSLRRRPRNLGQGWVLGTARYTGDALEWYRTFSLSPRPARVFGRHELEVRGRRRPQGAEALAVLPDHLVLQCADRTLTVELAMSENALTGLLSWLESAPPGNRLGVA